MIIVQIISQTLCHGLVMLMRMPHCSSSNTDTPLINTAQQEEQCLLSTLYFIWLHPCGGQCVWPTSLPPSPNFPSFSSLTLFASFFFSLDLTSVSAKVLFPSLSLFHTTQTPPYPTSFFLLYQSYPPCTVAPTHLKSQTARTWFNWLEEWKYNHTNTIFYLWKMLTAPRMIFCGIYLITNLYKLIR